MQREIGILLNSERNRRLPGYDRHTIRLIMAVIKFLLDNTLVVSLLIYCFFHSLVLPSRQARSRNLLQISSKMCSSSKKEQKRSWRLQARQICAKNVKNTDAVIRFLRRVQRPGSQLQHVTLRFCEFLIEIGFLYFFGGKCR